MATTQAAQIQEKAEEVKAVRENLQKQNEERERKQKEDLQIRTLQEKATKSDIQIIDTSLSEEAKIFLRYLIIDALPLTVSYSKKIVNVGFKKYLVNELQSIQNGTAKDNKGQTISKKNYLTKGEFHDIITEKVLKSSELRQVDVEEAQIMKFLKQNVKDDKKERYPYKYFENLSLCYKDIPANSKFNSIPFLLKFIDLLSSLYSILFKEESGSEYMSSLRGFTIFYLFFYGTPSQELIKEYVSICNSNSRRNDLIENLKDFKSRLGTTNRFYTTFISFLDEKIEFFSNSTKLSDERFEYMTRFKSIFSAFSTIQSLISSKLSELEN
jgi:hypothetical protein